MKEDEAVGKVSSVPSFARSRTSPGMPSRPSLEPTSSVSRDDMKRKGRARQLQKRAEEIEQEGGGDEEELDEDQLEIDEDDELALRRLGLNDMDDDDEDHMET